MNELYFAMDNVMGVVWISLGVAVVAALWLLLVYRRRLVRIPDACREQTAEADSTAAETPTRPLEGLSVLVYVQDNAEGLARVLADIRASAPRGSPKRSR